MRCRLGLHAETYSYLKIDNLLGKRGHLVVEAESILAAALGCEDEVALSLLLAAENDFVARRGDGVINIERATGLDLHTSA